jgi:hypothetical protein
MGARERLGAFADALVLHHVVSAARTWAVVVSATARRSVIEEFLGPDRAAAA